jgi:hypothetical protein
MPTKASPNKIRLYGKRSATLPKKFKPQLFQNADGRYSVVKELRRRLAELQADCGADSMQKRLLCENAIFIAAQLETMRVRASQGHEINMGAYTQAANALSGMLSKIGLEKKCKAELNELNGYLQSKNYIKGKKPKQKLR